MRKLAACASLLLVLGACSRPSGHPSEQARRLSHSMSPSVANQTKAVRVHVTKLPEGWTSNESLHRELEVRYPRRWTWARTTLTPHLSNPAEIFSVGTYPLRAKGPNCAQFPVNAISDLGPGDVLVSVQERSSAKAIDTSKPPLRPRYFRSKADSRHANDESPGCLNGPKTFSHWFIPFREYGRQFYAYVAFGNQASERNIRDAWMILGNLVPEQSP